MTRFFPQPRPIRLKLLAWYRRESRELPWRGTRDPYRVWVSEVMLQQTTVGAVRGRYERFIARFPDLPSLARAREESVLAEWSGLGYYNRARNLWRAARRVLREHSGQLPSDPAVLQRLPGLGDYTAAAVASLAFGVRVPAIDANVTRVISRLFAIGGPAGTRAHRRRLAARVREILPRRRPGDATAALMDLGQTICLPRRPGCHRCPLRKECLGLRRGSPQRYPARRSRPRAVVVHLAAAVATQNGRALLVRRRSSLLRGLWEFPSAEAPSAAIARRKLSRLLRSLGLRLDGPPMGWERHTIVNRRLSIAVLRAVASPRPGPPAPRGSRRWFRPIDLRRAAIPTLTRKIGQAAGVLPAPENRRSRWRATAGVS